MGVNIPQDIILVGFCEDIEIGGKASISMIFINLNNYSMTLHIDLLDERATNCY